MIASKKELRSGMSQIKADLYFSKFMSRGLYLSNFMYILQCAYLLNVSAFMKTIEEVKTCVAQPPAQGLHPSCFDGR